MDIEKQLNEKIEILKQELKGLSEPWQLLINEYTTLRDSNSPIAKQKFNEIMALQFKMKEMQNTINSLEDMLSPVLGNNKNYTAEAVETMRNLFESPLNEQTINDDTPSMGGR